MYGFQQDLMERIVIIMNMTKKEKITSNKYKEAAEELAICKGDCDSCPNDMRACLQLTRKKLAMICDFVDEFQLGVSEMTIQVIREKIDVADSKLKEMTPDDHRLFT